MTKNPLTTVIGCHLVSKSANKSLVPINTQISEHITMIREHCSSDGMRKALRRLPRFETDWRNESFIRPGKHHSVSGCVNWADIGLKKCNHPELRVLFSEHTDKQLGNIDTVSHVSNLLRKATVKHWRNPPLDQSANGSDYLSRNCFGRANTELSELLHHKDLPAHDIAQLQDMLAELHGLGGEMAEILEAQIPQITKAAARG